MRSELLGWCVLTAAIALAAPGQAASLGEGAIPWQVDYLKAHQERVDSRRPMLVFVTMESCPHCHRMLATTYQDQQIAASISESFVATVVDGSDQPKLCEQFGVRIFPTTYLVGPDNRILDRIEGYVGAEELRQRLGRVLPQIARRP